jgi:hypothetical protein
MVFNATFNNISVILWWSLRRKNIYYNKASSILMKDIIYKLRLSTKQNNNHMLLSEEWILINIQFT